jgi:hypothetical protein
VALPLRTLLAMVLSHACCMLYDLCSCACAVRAAAEAPPPCLAPPGLDLDESTYMEAADQRRSQVRGLGCRV